MQPFGYASRMVEGRRDRRKRLTRAAIAEHGWRLFAEHGFAAVTVARIAQAADVAVGTVFNYFPSKEAILFDRADELVEDLAATVRSRPPGSGVVAGFRTWHDRTIAFLTNPAAADRARRFLELIAQHPTLRAYERDLDDRYRETLAGILGETRRGHTDPTPALLAAQLVTLHRGVADLARDLVLDGVPPSTVRRRVNAATRTGFGLLAEHVHTIG